MKLAARDLPRDRADVHARQRTRSRCKPDGWTVVTSDGSLAAHFEHTIAVTDNGPEILTTRLMTDPTAGLPDQGRFDTLRVRVSVRPDRHSS